MEKINKKPSYR